MDSGLIKLIADGAVIPVVLIGSFILVYKVPKGQRFQSYSRILMAGLTAYLLSKLIGSIYQPSYQRPFELLGVTAGASYLDNPGFPSDHILFVMAITLAVWFETKQKAVTIVLLILVALIGTGRILALVHSPIDVIGGVVIALLGSFWYTILDKSTT